MLEGCREELVGCRVMLVRETSMLLGRRMNRSGYSHALIIDVAKVGTHYSTYCCGYRGQLYSHI